MKNIIKVEFFNCIKASYNDYFVIFENPSINNFNSLYHYELYKLMYNFIIKNKIERIIMYEQLKCGIRKYKFNILSIDKDYIYSTSNNLIDFCNNNSELIELFLHKYIN